MQSMSERIAALRKEKELTREALCAQLGLPKGTIDKIETGRKTPTAEQLASIASGLGASVAYLKGETDDRGGGPNWMEKTYREPAEPVRTIKARPTPRPAAESIDFGTAFFETPAVKEVIRKIVLETLQSPEGQKAIRKALEK